MFMKLIILGVIGYAIWYYINKVKKPEKLSKEDNKDSQADTKEKFCSECGAPLDKDALFCSECGAKVERQ